MNLNCPGCARPTTFDDIESCSYCETVLCNACGTKCMQCRKLACKICECNNYTLCNVYGCGSKQCDACMFECEICQEKTCRDHVNECQITGCDNVVCWMCSAMCDECDDSWFCFECSKKRTCIICKTPICPDCQAAYECLRCRNRYCPKHVSQCILKCGAMRCDNIECTKKFYKSHKCIEKENVWTFKKE